MATVYVLLILLALRSPVPQLQVWATSRSRPGNRLPRILGSESMLSQLPVVAALVGLAASAYVLPRADELGGEQAALLAIACAVAVFGG